MILSKGDFIGDFLEKLQAAKTSPKCNNNTRQIEILT